MPLDVGPHPEDLQLEQYSMGTLPEQAAGPLEEHLLVCELCQDRLLKMDTYVNAMRSVSPRWREESRRRQEVVALRSGLQRLWKAKLPLPVAMAACVLLAALVWVAPRGRQRVNVGAPVSVVLRSSRGPEDVLARVPFGKTPVFRL